MTENKLLTATSEPVNASYEDDLSLSDDTLAILQEFLREKAEREKLFSENSVPNNESNSEKTKPIFEAFEENWVNIVFVFSHYYS